MQVPPSIPEIRGVLSTQDCRRTGESIARAQHDSGCVPWFAGGQADPWDHVQAAMGLSVSGHWDEAVAAYDWSRRSQRGDGTWAARYVDGTVAENDDESGSDASFCAYLATGVWHHWRISGDDAFLERMWPAVRGGVDAALSMQRSGGEIAWRRFDSESLSELTLLTGNASIALSVRCAIALAGAIGEQVPDWELAAGSLRHALDDHPDRFDDKSRYSMDWYYPVLGGGLRPGAATDRLDSRWDDFVVADLGIRCVSDHPWVTGAETCELVLALDAAGRPAAARRLLGDMQHLREPDGSYWTGLVYTDGKNWPVERTTWTAATVLLAADALSGATAANGLFRGEGLPQIRWEGPCPCPATR